MITDPIENRIAALSPQAKKLLLLKTKEAIAMQSKNNTSNNKKIVAYLEGTTDFSIDELKTALKSKLPDYMVPSQIITVDKMPLLPNGKIDKKQLQKSNLHQPKPVTKTKKSDNNTSILQEKLTTIWEETLGFSPINKEDNFFEIGGDSILSIQIIAKAKKAGISLEPNALFEHQTIAELALFTKTETKVAAKNTISEKLITIWEETLGFSPINKEDNFFEIGGDSILSIQIIAKAKKEGINLQPNALFEYQTIAELALFATLENDNKSTIEEKLIAIWEETLGFSPINKEDNFFEIGGDSILSIQIVAKAKKEGITIQPNALFEHQNIAELALFATEDNQSISNLLIKGETPLTPIQHWFFKDHTNAPQYWNQGVQLDGIDQFTKEHLNKVCTYIISQHDALRASFKFYNNSWTQEILLPQDVNTLMYIDFTQVSPENYTDKASKKLQEVQRNFKLSEGSLFKCLYFNTGNAKTNFCYLVAHHLVVDAVSWQIIIDDFISAVNQIKINKALSQEPKTSSIKEWSTYVNNYAHKMNANELSFWNAQITTSAKLPIDKNDSKIIEEKDVIRHQFSLDEKTTKQLLEANNAYNTKVDELLISAFSKTISSWSGNKEVTIGFEKHGRETNNTKIDLSKTVGWLTAYFPVKFDNLNDDTLKNQIVNTKEKMRSIPNGGIGYGALRYVKKTFGEVENPEIVFNFLGTKTTKNTKDTITTTPLTDNLRDPKSERRYKLEVNLQIVNNILQASLSYANTMYAEETILQLLNDFKDRIIAIIEHCNTTESGGYTPSDFSETEISQDDLDNLLDLLE